MDDGYYQDGVGHAPGATAPGVTAQPPSFILIPLNTAARSAASNPRNMYRQYTDTNTFGLWFDFADQESFKLGRGEGMDIYLPESVGRGGKGEISSHHASFELVPITGAVLLYDHSRNHTTEPFSGRDNDAVTIKFRRGTRSVLVARGINKRIAFGRDRYYQFELQWRSEGIYDIPRNNGPYVVGPQNSQEKRYIQGGKVGGGAYGNVWQALDVTSGSIMAVKQFHNMSGKNLDFANREVANLVKISKNRSARHQGQEHILQIFDYAFEPKHGWGEIFMPLMEGNLKTLLDQTPGIDDWEVADTVLRQMLLALQCTASHKIVHRDIKPENILWQYDANGNYHFCLGDFGLSNDPKIARTIAGTPPFMAPEVYNQAPQTTKVDIWSLFATVVWVRNTQQFRNLCGQYQAPDIHRWLISIANTDPAYENIRYMAQKDPRKRPSASKQLAMLDGELADSAVYDVGSGDDVADQLGDQFGTMNIQDDPGNYQQSEYDQGDYAHSGGGPPTSPPAPYYEPYTTHLMDQYDWEKDPGGPSRGGYTKPDLPRGGQEPEWPVAYGGGYDAGRAAGGGGDGDSGEGTTVPDMMTQRPFEEDQPTYRESNRRKQKGKHRA